MMSNEKTVKIIRDYFNEISYGKEIDFWLKSNSNLVVIKGEIFCIDDNQKKLVDKFYNKIIYIGKRLGRLGNKFYPSLSFLEEICDMTKVKIDLNNKKSWLFVCGRDLFISEVAWKDYVFVTKKNHFIGLAKKDKKGFKNLLDIGMYLRAQNKL